MTEKNYGRVQKIVGTNASLVEISMSVCDKVYTLSSRVVADPECTCRPLHMA